MSSDVKLSRRVMAARRLVTDLQRAHQNVDQLVFSHTNNDAEVTEQAESAIRLRHALEDALADARDLADRYAAAERTALGLGEAS